MPSFGDLLREHRLAAGIGQETLAERARLSVETVSALERGARQRPYLETIANLAEALGLADEDRANLERAAKRRSFRALASLEPPRNNLPLQLSSFVGRSRDVANVRGLLASYRLVTLVGAGGVGKTRLGLAVATEFSNRREHLWFVDLSAYGDSATIPAAIAAGVGLAGATLLETLAEYIQTKDAFLILDNCEHLIEGAAHAVAVLLERAPDLQILATSRQALAIPGERVYRVPPLGCPGNHEASPSVGEALTYDAIELFSERARGADSAFELNAKNLPAVVEICRRLDGIALAIELAAARTSAFSPAMIAHHLEHHFLTMTGGGRAPLPRQRTMHSVFEWSYGLLDDRERILFRKLAIFAGGFSLELAGAVCAGEVIDEASVANILASLVDKSLVQTEGLDEIVRYRMLEPTRQYAREKLREHGEERATARRHAFALLELAERLDGTLELTPDRVWDTQVTPERENFREAFDWALSPDGDATIAQRMAASRAAASFGAPTGEARRWIDAALQTVDGATPRNIAAALATADARMTLLLHGDPHDALRAMERSSQFGSTADPRVVAEGQLFLGLALMRTGRVDEGEARLHEALETARAARATRLVVTATQALAWARGAVGDFSTARELCSESLRLVRAAGCERLVAIDAPNLAEYEFAEGHTEAAIQLALEAATFLRAHQTWSELALALGNASAYLVSSDRFADARTHAREAVVVAHESGRHTLAAMAVQHLAAIAALDPTIEHDRSNLDRAAQLLGYVDEYAARAGLLREHTDQREYDRVLASLREKLAERVDPLIQSGKSWSEDRAIAEAFEI